MSKIALSGNPSGTGTFTIASPNSNTDRTVNLPDAGGDMVLTTATQTLTNKTIQGGTITLATAVASTSGTSIDFTSIPSWVKRITVMFSGVSTNGTSAIQIQIGVGSFTTSGYLGAGANAASTFSPVASTASSGFLLMSANSAAATYHGQSLICLQTGNTWVQNSVLGRSDTGAVAWAGNSVALSGTLDRVRITTVNGTDAFDAGTINIMYEG
jgi:hypothetical protein